MHLRYRNVNGAFAGLVRVFYEGKVDAGPLPLARVASRYGDATSITEPVTISYSHPQERVLFNAARDVNPFSLLYESLYILTGRNDVRPLAYYTKKFAEFSDDGVTLNDSYGYRWRKGRRYERSGVGSFNYPVDQLSVLIQHLHAKPLSRRAVLSMWNVEDDLLKIGEGNCSCLGPTPDGISHYPGCRVYHESRGVCCNLTIHFRVRDAYLDMTVFNRSNDLVWGALGANYVCFSVLLEYVASHLGLEVGSYHQVSDDLHVYSATFDPEPWLVWRLPGYESCGAMDWYHVHPTAGLFPLVATPDRFDWEVVEFVERHSCDAVAGEYSEPFLSEVAQPMCVAYHYYKRGDLDGAATVARSIAAPDWRLACTAWIERRRERRSRERRQKDDRNCD